MQIIPLTVGPPSRAVVGQSSPEAMRRSRFILMEKGETAQRLMALLQIQLF